MAERLEAAASDEYTQDGTVDLHGNPVLRSKRGGWKACGFVVGTYVRTGNHTTGRIIGFVVVVVGSRLCFIFH